MIKREKLESMLKELKLQKRELVLAYKDTDKIDKEINNVEMELESIAASEKEK